LILADTSAVVAFLRGDGSSAHVRMRELMAAGGGDVALTEPVVMEVLAGARGPDHRRDLRRMVATLDLLPVWGLDDYEAAGDLWAACRRKGITIRSTIDCLIAQVAIRHDVPLLHADHDFRELAAISTLRLVDAS
jgi:predicted nucleic acid-binding protein